MLVIDPDQRSAEVLRGMIEFLDTPRVIVADDQNWRSALDDALDVVFLGHGLADATADDIEYQLHRDCPTLAVVRVGGARGGDA